MGPSCPVNGVVALRMGSTDAIFRADSQGVPRGSGGHMADTKVSIQLPNGEMKNVLLPDDVPVAELLPELVTTLGIPVVGPDGRPMNYRLDSKALGRALSDEETLADAALPEDDRLVLSPVVVAGGADLRAGRVEDPA